MHLRFSMMAQYYEGVEGHPQKVMKDLGITYQHATPQSMGDQWWFWNCEGVPETLPKFLSELNIDPQDCIGFGLNQELADRITSYK